MCLNTVVFPQVIDGLFTGFRTRPQVIIETAWYLACLVEISYLLRRRAICARRRSRPLIAKIADQVAHIQPIEGAGPVNITCHIPVPVRQAVAVIGGRSATLKKGYAIGHIQGVQITASVYVTYSIYAGVIDAVDDYRRDQDSRRKFGHAIVQSQ